MDQESLISALLELNSEEQNNYKSFLSGKELQNDSHCETDGAVLTKPIAMEKLLRYCSFPVHSHSFIELSYIVRGTVKYTVNGIDHLQTEGSFTVIPPGTMHTLYANPDALCMTVKIKNEVFLSLRKPDIPSFSIPITFPCAEDHFVRYIFLSMWEQQERHDIYSDELINTLLDALLTYLLQNYRDCSVFLGVYGIPDTKMAPIAAYLVRNYKTVTLRSLAEEFHYNESYLSHMIHVETGVSFTEALRIFRLARARELLLSTSSCLNEICDEIGYKDSTRFIKDFKHRYGITPAKYRRLYTVLE